MARLNIIECDRCHSRIRNQTGVTKVEISGLTTPREIEVCDSCATKLTRLLDGEELEIPP
jgi:hypothetical protein